MEDAKSVYEVVTSVWKLQKEYLQKSMSNRTEDDANWDGLIKDSDTLIKSFSDEALQSLAKDYLFAFYDYLNAKNKKRS